MELQSPIVIHLVQDKHLPGILEVYRQSQDFLALGPDPVASPEMILHDLAISRREGGRFCSIFDLEGNILGIVDYVSTNFEGCP